MNPVAGRFGASLMLGALALGCSAEVEHYSTDAETGSSAHALVSVQRSVSLDGTTPRSEVLAGFVRVPADVESRPLYELLGLSAAIPPVGQCRERSLSADASPLSGIGKIELLEAGDVWVGAPGAETTLAPHAFPSVTDRISGVLYASRDRSASAFPAATSYSVRIGGGASVPGFTLAKEAPPELDTVTVGGLALVEVKELVVSAPIDVTWGVGASGDVVVAELSTADGVLACAFRDELGAGTIPAARLERTGSGRFSLHRLRTASFRAPGVDFGELAFEFELGANVHFKL